MPVMPDRSPARVPHLETERLRLRGHCPADFVHCAAMWADPLVTRYIGGTPLSKEESWGRMLRYAGHWAWLGFGYWAIEEKATGDFVGEAGFADYRRNLEPSFENTPEIGWVLAAPSHGKGYATEAARAVVAWGDLHFSGLRTACIIHPEHEASIRVAEKCGYRKLRSTVYKGQPTIVFTRNPGGAENAVTAAPTIFS
jgi:RimJ/RimL family protein N-acetyltransferase